MDIIFRIQNKNGKGPYLPHVKCLTSHGLDMAHPSPFEDVGIERLANPEEYCGFHNMKQLKEWFDDKMLMELKKVGFTIVKVQGKITAKGEKQILFIPA